MKWISTPIQQRFYETDGYNIVNHMFFLSWLELGRFYFAEQVGLKMEKFPELSFLVSGLKIDYKQSVCFRDKIEVDTGIQVIKGSKICFIQRIRNSKNGAVYAQADVDVIVCENRQLLIKLPDEIRNLLIGKCSSTGIVR